MHNPTFETQFSCLYICVKSAAQFGALLLNLSHQCTKNITFPFIAGYLPYCWDVLWETLLDKHPTKPFSSATALQARHSRHKEEWYLIPLTALWITLHSFTSLSPSPLRWKLFNLCWKERKKPGLKRQQTVWWFAFFPVYWELSQKCSPKVRWNGIIYFNSTEG